MIASPLDHRNLFDVYLGLTATGYDLANPHRAQKVTEAIRRGAWASVTVAYFEKARIDDGRVNPYWPRAWLLSVAGYLDRIPQIGPCELDDRTLGWIEDLPGHVRGLRASSSYGSVFALYRDAVRIEVERDGDDYEGDVQAARSRLRVLLPELPLRVDTVVNPLQADPQTDVVDLACRICVIVSHPRGGSAGVRVRLRRGADARGPGAGGGPSVHGLGSGVSPRL